MQLSAKAYAKINLYLDVVGKREDGYHFLDMIMQSVDIFDFITVKENNRNEIRVICENTNIKPEDNIVYKACLAFLDRIKSNVGVDVNIKKNIQPNISASKHCPVTKLENVLLAIEPISFILLTNLGFK